jgi:hypothetical protein
MLSERKDDGCKSEVRSRSSERDAIKVKPAEQDLELQRHPTAASIDRGARLNLLVCIT